MDGFNDAYQAVFNQVKAVLATNQQFQAINVGEAVRITNLPLAIVNPEPSPAKSVAQNLIEVDINFSVVCVIRETEPANWFADIIPILSAAVDAVLADRSLAGTVKNTNLTGFAPSVIKFNNRLYYGGVVRFQALLLYLPT